MPALLMAKDHLPDSVHHVALPEMAATAQSPQLRGLSPLAVVGSRPSGLSATLLTEP